MRGVREMLQLEHNCGIQFILCMFMVHIITVYSYWDTAAAVSICVVMKHVCVLHCICISVQDKHVLGVSYRQRYNCFSSQHFL